MLEEYGPEIKYIKGPDDDTADALSRMLLTDSDVEEKEITWKHLSESCCVEKLDSNKLPLLYRTIYKYQRKDKNLAEN